MCYYYSAYVGRENRSNNTFVCRAFSTNFQIYGTEAANFNKMLNSTSATLATLIAAYIAFLLPGVLVSFGSWPVNSTHTSYRIRAITASM